LLEPQRTNLALRSEEFDNATWSKNNASVTANATTSPSGIVNADSLIELATTAFHGVSQSLTLSAVAYTFSFYAKPNGRNFIQWNNSLNTDFVNFNISTGAVGSSQNVSGATAQSVGNGWYRCSFQYTATASTGNWFRLTLITSATSVRLENYLGDGTSGAFLWGAQLEAGAYQTSYIPTSSASVTRNADIVQKTGVSSLIGQTEGTLYWEGTMTSGQTDDLFYINRSITNSVFIYKNAVNAILFRVFYGGSFITITNPTSYTGTIKIAASYKSGDSVLYINGVQVGTSATAFAFTGALNDVVLNNTAFLFGNEIKKSVKTAALFPTRLTNAQLAALTA
jgi:hypothetical protein